MVRSQNGQNIALREQHGAYAASHERFSLGFHVLYFHG